MSLTNTSLIYFVLRNACLRGESSVDIERRVSASPTSPALIPWQACLLPGFGTGCSHRMQCTLRGSVPRPGIMKQTKAQAFEKFKKEFKKWQHLLQLDGYEVRFSLVDLDIHYARVRVDEENKAAHVEVDKKDILKMSKTIAKHEACHLFLGKFNHLAYCRFVADGEIAQEWEKLSNILEKVL